MFFGLHVYQAEVADRAFEPFWRPPPCREAGTWDHCRLVESIKHQRKSRGLPILRNTAPSRLGQKWQKFLMLSGTIRGVPGWPKAESRQQHLEMKDVSAILFAGRCLPS
jgi:hypothetical protein